MPAQEEDSKKPTCFIAMPVATREAEAELYEDDAHWEHVRESLFIPAIEAAGFEPIRPVASGSHLIHAVIIKQLSEADMVLVDLSSHNPNVFFELGVRTSLNLPIALVRDERTSLPFDTSGINTHSYNSLLRGWEVEAQRESLRAHLTSSTESCAGENPLWKQFGLVIRAHEPSAEQTPLEAKLDLLASQVAKLESRKSASSRRSPDRLAESTLSATEYLSQSLESELIDEDRRIVDAFSRQLKRFCADKPYKARVANSDGRHVSVRLSGDWSVESRAQLHEFINPWDLNVSFQREQSRS